MNLQIVNKIKQGFVASMAIAYFFDWAFARIRSIIRGKSLNDALQMTQNRS